MKTDRDLLSKKVHFWPNLGQKDPKWPQNRVCLDFWKILSLGFLGNNLKWKLILLLMLHHQCHIWQNSWFQVMDQMLSANQIARFFKTHYLKKEVNDETCFWLADKHRSLLQVDTVILTVRSQTCPKCTQ